MNKKIKILLTIAVLIIATFIFSNTSSAWSPANQTPVYPQGETYFCREKGGAVRFTQMSSYYKLRYDSDAFNQYECRCGKCGHESVNLDMIEAQGNDDLRNIYAMLAEYTRPIPSNSYQLRWYNGNLNDPGGTDVPYGPKVALTPVLNAVGTPTRTNDTVGYILSSGPSVSPIALGHKKGNYKTTESDKADANTKQYALWADSTFNKGNILGANGLYLEAKEFQEFYRRHNIAGGYNASIDNSKAQVIANRNDQTYIIGPYRVFYPDNVKFSYIEDMTVTANGVTVQPLQIMFASKSGEKVYPSTGEEFFVQFSAAATGYPTSAEVNIKFCYIQIASATYEELEGKGEIKQFIQHRDNYTRTGVGVHRWTTTEPVYGPSGIQTGTKEVTHEETHYHPHYGMKLYISLDLVGYYKAQAAAHLVSSQRIWKNHSIKTSIDLTMSLGGYVWEDTDGGKESIQDGKYNSSSEKKMPNVIVTLSDGQTTKTNENGEYRFSGLNAMQQYYVKFTYNGQYYQPTNYSSSSTWGNSDWTKNSNATDIKSDRVSYNLRFEKIGSSPENYSVNGRTNETFTKQQLLGYTLQADGTYRKTREAVIDEFGNLILGDSGDATTRKMIQYVKDCMIDAYTGNGDGGYDLYPVPSIFTIDTFQYPSSLTPSAEVLYDNAYYINLGLNAREESDLAIKKDIQKVDLEINGQKHTYTYDTLENKANAENTWDISLRLSDVISGNKYYDTNYSRELYKSDYIYKVSNYGENYADYGKSKQDELEVYVTYKIMVRNQAMSIQARIDELVDYYDNDLEYVDSRSYIEIKRGNNTGKYAAQASATSRYSNATRTTINGYDNLYIKGLAEGAQLIDEKGNPTGGPITNGIYLEAGQTAYVYLTFKVKKDVIENENWIRLDEEIVTANAIGVGKENIVEINGYSTRYAKGTQVPNVGDVSYNPAGIVDRDSNPGNLNPSDVPKDGQINYQNFEDDTDKAPNIRIILNRDDNTVRVILGSVWEDERNESIGVTTTGDGIRDNKDKTLINGVTVQLVELMENGTEFNWRTFENGSGTASETTPIINAFNLVENYKFESDYSGQYAFKSFVPGKYVIRFIYGDTVKTVTPKELNMGGLNEKSYNGQDFKSTTYQEGIEQNKVYTWREQSTWQNGQETIGKVLTEVSTFKADASNNETANAKANQLKAYLYDITASDAKNNVSDAKDIESRRNEVIDYSDNDVTNYIAEVLASHKVEYQDKSYKTANDKQVLLNDLMANTQMRAETGLIVIEFEYDQIGTDGNKKDNTYKIQNVDLGLEERPKAQLAINKEVTNVKLSLADGSILFDAKNTASNVLWRDHKAYNLGYKGNVLDEEKFGNIQNIRSKNANKFGLIQLSMDEELMHGATIEITYQVTVSNVGEVDYKDNLFYYTGNKSANAQIVTTRADQVIDYVANNLQFNVSNNSNWKVIEKDEIKSQGLVNSILDKQVEKYNTIIETKDLNKDLVPSLYKDKQDKNATDSVSVPLVLTQLITSENDSDDLTYRNLVEIVKTSNTLGRRMEYSVVGNQNPEIKPQELDSDIAEIVRILPPFGNAGIYITIAIVTLAAVVIVIGGTIFIKKKVLRK